MKKLIAALLFALVLPCAQAQTTIAPVSGGVYNSSGTLIGAVNRSTGAEEPFTLNTFTGPLSAAKGGTGVANNSAATLTRSGSHALTLTTTGTTGVTLPTSGTLAILGANTFTGVQTAPGVVSLMSGQSTAARLGQISDVTQYSQLSLNGVYTLAGMQGVWGGGGNTLLVIGAPTGHSISLRLNNTEVIGVAGTTATVTGSFVMATSSSPASGAACTAGTVTWDTGFVYVCTASGAWKRAALTGSY